MSWGIGFVNSDERRKIRDMNKESFYCQWHITDRCNLSCKHCYQNATKAYSDVDYEKLTLVADKLDEACNKWNVNLEIALTGGEPFSRKNDCLKLLEYISNKSTVVRIDILSNGLLLTPDIVKELKLLKKLNSIQISLESYNEKTHDEIRGVGSFCRAIDAIRLLKSNGLKCGTMMTLSKLNYKNIRKMYNFATQLNLDYFGVDRFIPEEIDKYGFNASVLNKEELKEAFEEVGKLFNERKKTRKGPELFPYRPLFCLLNEDVGSEFGGACSAGGSSLTIMPNGDVLPCRRLPIKVGNILQDGVFKIWYTSDVLWKLRNGSGLSEKCATCKYLSKCRGCRAMAYAVTGNYMGEDMLCWKQ